MNRQSYFIDQLCTIGVAGAYAVAMAMLYAQDILQQLLTGWIQIVVLIGSGVLVALVILRAVHLWRAASPGPEAEHEHAHAHGIPHSHEHAHDHGHEHSWSPWRYAVLVFPLMLFLLFGSAYKDMIDDFIQRRARAQQDFEDVLEVPEGLAAYQLVSLTQGPIGGTVPVVDYGGLQFAFEEAEGGSATGKAEATIDLGLIDQVAGSPDQRELWKKYRRVQVEGIYSPMVREGKPDNKLLQIVRMRMACCLNDARPAALIAMSREKLDENLRPGQWVTAHGRLDFKQAPDGKWRPVFKITRTSDMKATKQPANPYLN